MLTLINIFREGLGEQCQPLMPKLKEILKQLLLRCMASHEYAERLMGIRLLGLLMGLGKEWKDKGDMMRYIQGGWGYFKQFIGMSVQLESDWQEDVIQTAQLINNIVVSSELRLRIAQKSTSDRKNCSHIVDNSIFTLPADEELSLEHKNPYDTL